MNENMCMHFFCTTVSTYWNQELHNDGSWSPSFMTSLTNIDNLDGIMAGITPKSTNGKNDLYRAMPFDGDKKAKHPRPTCCRSQFFPHWSFHLGEVFSGRWVFSFSGWTYFETPVYEITKNRRNLESPAHIQACVWYLYIYIIYIYIYR